MRRHGITTGGGWQIWRRSVRSSTSERRHACVRTVQFRNQTELDKLGHVSVCGGKRRERGVWEDFRCVQRHALTTGGGKFGDGRSGATSERGHACVRTVQFRNQTELDKLGHVSVCGGECRVCVCVCVRVRVCVCALCLSRVRSGNRFRKKIVFVMDYHP